MVVNFWVKFMARSNDKARAQRSERLLDLELKKFMEGVFVGQQVKAQSLIHGR